MLVDYFALPSKAISTCRTRSCACDCLICLHIDGWILQGLFAQVGHDGLLGRTFGAIVLVWPLPSGPILDRVKVAYPTAHNSTSLT